MTYTQSSEYDAHGNVVKQVDGNGNVTLYEYDLYDRPTKRIEAAGKLDATTEYAYAYGEMSVDAAVPFDSSYTYRYEKNSAGNVSLLVENKFGQPMMVVDEIGRLTRYHVNAAQQMVGITMPNGGNIVFNVDGRGRQIRKTGPTTEEIVTVYDDANRQIKTIVTNPATGDQVSTAVYNLFDTIAETSNPLGVVTRFEHDAANHPIRVIENVEGEAKRTTEHELDERGRVIHTTVNQLASTDNEYFPSGRLKSVTNGRAASVTMVYDERGLLVTQTDAGGGITHHVYDGNGNRIATVDPRAEGDRDNAVFRQTYEYDELNRLITSINPLGETTRYEYDLLGNQTRIIDPRSTEDTPIETQFEYDRINRLTKTTNAQGRSTRYEYDLSDNATKITRQRLTLEGIVNDVTEYVYDLSSRLQEASDAAGYVTTYQYDATGNMTSIIDQRGSAARTDFTHDKLNRVVKQTMAAGSTIAASTQTIYHPLGMVQETIDPMGQRVVTTFDSLLRPETTIIAKDSTKPAVTTYEYDVVGNLISLSDPRGDFYKRSFEHDKMNRQIKESGNSGTVASPKPYEIVTEYNDVGQPVRQTDPRGGGLETRMDYDAAGRLTVQYDALDQETRYQYDAAGNTTRIDTPSLDGVSTAALEFQYDALGNRTSMRDALGNTTCFVTDDSGNVLLTVDPRANLTTCNIDDRDNAFATQMFYDALGRRIAVVDTGGYRAETEYDALGNITKQIDPRTFDAATPGEFVTEYVYDPLGRLTETHSPIGMMGSDEIAIEKFSYDLADNLVRYEDPRGPEYATTYEYDPLYNRTVSRQNVVVATTGPTVLETISEYDLVGNLVRSVDPRGAFHAVEFEYDGGNRLVAMIEPTGTEADPGPLAITRYEFDEAGNLIAEQDPRGEYYTVRRVVDPLGRVESQSVPRGSADQPLAAAVTTYQYFPGGTIKAIHNPRENAGEDIRATVFSYDVAGRQISMIDSLGAVTQYELDAIGNALTITEVGEGATPTRTTQMEYDRLNRMTKVIDATGLETITEYDALGNAVRVTGPLSNANGPSVIERVYDGRSMVRSETNAEGDTTTYEYDFAGNRIAIGDPRGDWADTTMEYDGANRMIATHYATGSAADPGQLVTTRMEYDGIGNVTRVIDPRGDDFATETVFDHRGLPIEVRYSAGREENPTIEVDRFEYDLAGNLVRSIDPRGDDYATAHTVNAAGQITSTTYAVLAASGPSHLTETFAYDAEGNRTLHIGIGGNDYITRHAYDAVGRVTSTTDAIGEQTSYRYDRYGNVLAVTDVYGTTNNTYDALNRLQTTTNAENETTVYEYSGTGLEVTTRDPLGRTSQTIRDRLGRVVESIDAAGQSSFQEYDAVGNVVRIIDRNGVVSESIYDARKMPLSVTRAVDTPQEITTRYEYDSLGRQVAQIDPRGDYYRTETVYDARNRMIEQRRHAGTPTTPGIGSPDAEEDWIVEKYEYDSVGHLIAMTPARGDFYTVYTEVDGLGRVTQITQQVGTPANPAEAVQKFQYNNAGQKVRVVDALGHVITRDYDLVGRMVSETVEREGADDLVTHWNYLDTDAGYRIEQVDAAGNLSLATDYDKVQRVVTIQPRSGETENRSYDDAGNLVTATVGDIRREFEYNELNRLARESDGQDHNYTYSYDAVGNLLTKQDARQSNPVVYVYDALNLQRSIRQSDGGLTQLEYDKAGNLSRVMDAEGNVTSFEFDAMHRMVNDTNKFGSRTYTYDPAGNPTRYVDRNGRVTVRHYDGNSRLLQEDWLDATGSTTNSLSFTYDVLGRMTNASRGEASNTFAFADDATSQVTAVTTSIAVGVAPLAINYERNKLGQTTSFTASLGSQDGIIQEAYAYGTTDDRLVEIEQTGTAVNRKRVEFEYHDGVSVYKEIRRYGSDDARVLTTTTLLNDRQLIDQIQHRSATTGTINQYRYTYDADARITSIADEYGRATYQYDASGRLISVSNTDPQMADESFTLDDVGNRTASSEHGDGYSYVEQNRLASDGMFYYDYDAEGNLITQTAIETGEVMHYQWDHRNRLLASITEDANGNLVEVVEIGYDALNRRVWKRVDPDGVGNKPVTWRGYLYNADDVLFEVVDVGGLGVGAGPVVDVVYLHGASGDTPLAQDHQGSTTWLLPDHLGTVRDLVGADGQRLDHLRYSAYGAIVSRLDPNVFNRYFFTGHSYEPELGWYNFRARYYDPTNGRFVSIDPIGLSAGDPNQYRYAMSDPINMADPTGLSGIPSAMANPYFDQMRSVRDAVTDSRLAFEKNMSVGNFNVMTFAMGTISSTNIAVEALATIAATVALSTNPVTAPYMVYYTAYATGKTAYGLVKQSQQPGREGFELWDGVKLLLTVGASAIGPTVGTYASVALNSADVYVALAYEKNLNAMDSRLMGSTTGLIGDVASYHATTGLSTTSKGVKGDFAVMKAEWSGTVGQVRDGTIPYLLGVGKNLKGLASDVTRLQQYQADVQTYRQSLAGNADAIAIRNQIKPPDFQTNTFKQFARLIDAAQAAKLGWHGSLDHQIRSVAVNRIGERGELSMKMLQKDIAKNPELAEMTPALVKMEQDLISAATSAKWDYPLDLNTQGNRACNAGRAFIDEIRGTGYTSRIEATQNRVIQFNAEHNPVYRKLIGQMVDAEINRSGAMLTSTAKASLREQAIALHASTLIRVNNPAAPTLSAPFSHLGIKNKLPKMINRVKGEVLNRMYPTLEKAIAQHEALKFYIKTGDTTQQTKNMESLLRSHVGTLQKQRAGLRAYERGMKELFPSGRQPMDVVGYTRYQQAQAMKKILTDHPYSFEGPFNHLADRLITAAPSEFAEILDLPFTTRQDVQDLADVARAINNGKLEVPGINKGGVVALMLQGTAGATLSQIAFRADFIKDVYSGNFQRLHGTLQKPLEAWRTLADITKSPMMEGTTDVDMGLIVKGGGNNLLSVFKEAQVTFPNGKIQRLPGGDAISAIVKYSDPQSFIGRTARKTGVEVPVEWYVYQNQELAQIADAAAARSTPIDRGGISVITNGNSFDVVAHYSPHLDPAAQLGGASRTILSGMMHSAVVQSSTSRSIVTANELGPALIEAMSRWHSTDLDLPEPTIHLRVESLGGTRLGYTTLDRIDQNGHPIEATIVIDDDAAGHGWFVDPTPSSDTEFLVDTDGIMKASEDPAIGRFDVLSVMQHELGHLYGFTESFDGFDLNQASNRQGRQYVATSTETLWLDPSGSELDSSRHASLLMAGSIQLGVRKTPSPAEVDSIAAALDSSQFGFASLAVDGDLTAAVIGFTPIREALLAANDGISHGVTNGRFTQTHPDAADFGWTMVGDIRVADNQATISESVGMISDLSQTFVVPQGTRSVSFTLGGITLDVGQGDHPSEAFEVAILSTNTIQSISDEMVGLAGGDAILNIAPDGTTRFASGVTVEGITDSGDKITDLAAPIRVTAALPEFISETAVTVFYDLIGFGEDTSRTQVSNVLLESTNTLTWHNADLSVDVSGDGKISPYDALLIINELTDRRYSHHLTGTLVTVTSTVHPPPYFDVTNDGKLTAEDAVRVINALSMVPPPLLAGWQNPRLHEDINDDGKVTAGDALLLINELVDRYFSDPETGKLCEIDATHHPAPYYDCNGDGKLTAVDALMTINYLSRQQTGETEQAVTEGLINLLSQQQRETAF
ncbi:dockerin type I domain-containing protein [Novipirellula artificiosorum]|uniref:tRNA3(Ser)-specific nuclease WapA n=1 Tax=Novipirellula artificiosorum TaxID=2528016 RepID=A0A5C6D6L5_9BACT|nr:dockerin type I domain-containing protein [Novipirellula artificiosorum]TWU32833.1 tRNA3(Ser)-specific nuclease WapA precursor [Novipirellula artificiosorum]